MHHIILESDQGHSCSKLNTTAAKKYRLTTNIYKSSKTLAMKSKHWFDGKHFIWLSGWLTSNSANAVCQSQQQWLRAIAASDMDKGLECWSDGAKKCRLSIQGSSIILQKRFMFFMYIRIKFSLCCHHKSAWQRRKEEKWRGWAQGGGPPQQLSSRQPWTPLSRG